MIEHRLSSLLPLTALIDQRVAQPDPCAQIKDMPGRDPRLRQPLDHQQLTQMPRVRAIVLGALLITPPRARLRRLREMHHSTHRAQLLDDEPPPSRRLQRHIELLAAEALQELTHARTVSRRHPSTLHLAGLSIEPVSGDLRSMLVKSHYDCHQGPPQAPRFECLRGPVPRLS